MRLAALKIKAVGIDEILEKMDLAIAAELPQSSKGMFKD